MGGDDGSRRDQGMSGFEGDNENDSLVGSFHSAFEKSNLPLLAEARRHAYHIPVEVE